MRLIHFSNDLQTWRTRGYHPSWIGLESARVSDVCSDDGKGFVEELAVWGEDLVDFVV